MREMEFTIENTEALKPGMEVNVTEGVLPSSYYYMIEHALGMSAGSLLSYAGSQLLPLPARHAAAVACAAGGLACFAVVKPLCQNGTRVAKGGGGR